MSTNDNVERKSQYRVLDKDLAFLHDLNDGLAALERKLEREVVPTSLPIAFIGGLQRSGTTLLYQLFARHCDTGYVSNIMARFWNVPLVGGTLSRILATNRRCATQDLASDYGVTADPLGPHEFGYFWTKWLRLEDAATHLLTDDEASRVEWPALMKCLRQISGVFGLPFVSKNPIACWNAPRMFPHFSDLRLIIVHRDPFFVAQSTYVARKQRYGEASHWWSLKPPSFDRIRSEPDMIRQVVAQVKECEAVFSELAARHPSHCLVVEYQELRRDSERIVRDLSAFCGIQVKDDCPFPLPSELPNADRVQVSPDEAQRIERALAAYAAKPRPG